MQIIIFEGIATSGKTTIIKKILSELGKEKEVVLIDEAQTLMPILNNIDRLVSLSFLQELIEDVFSKNKDKDIIIFDRLLLTHIFRTNSQLAGFGSLIEVLKEHEVLMVLLTIGSKYVKDRTLGAMKHRSSHWGSFVKRKGDSRQIVEYYRGQQAFFSELVKQLPFQYVIKDTTDMNFEQIKEEVLEMII